MIFHFWVSSREPSQIFHSDSGFDEKLAAKSVSHEPSFLPVKQNLDSKTSHFNYRYVTISQKSKFNSESQSYCQTQSLQYEGDLMDPRNSELGLWPPDLYCMPELRIWFLILHTYIYKDLFFYLQVIVGPKKHLSREFGPHHNYHNQSQISEIFSLTQPSNKD